MLKPTFCFIICVLELLFLVASWGLTRKSKSRGAFRPAMSLSTGELSGLHGSILMMTATATPATQRILQNQFPEIHNWRNLLSSPLRENVVVVVPPPEMISSKLEIMLAPFVKDMVDNGRVYLVLVRGKSDWLFWEFL